MTKAGKFITIEGPEGSGKTTLTKLLVEELRRNGISAVTSKEPGTAFNGELRKLILGANPAPMAELFLFLADRAEHIAKYVAPALQSGSWVILDRFSDSTVVYQAIAKKTVTVKMCEELCRLAEQDHLPDLTLVLKAGFDTCQKRLAGRPDQIKRVAQQGGLELEHLIWSAYDELPDFDPTRFRAISAESTDPQDTLRYAWLQLAMEFSELQL